MCCLSVSELSVLSESIDESKFGNILSRGLPEPSEPEVSFSLAFGCGTSACSLSLFVGLVTYLNFGRVVFVVIILLSLFGCQFI